MHKGRIIFRADGNRKIGLGHVVRCIGLIEMLNQNFECIFVIRHPDEKIKKLIGVHCKLIQLMSRNLKEEAIELSAIINKEDILVLDGYYFDSEYQQSIKLKINKLVMIDDKADHHYYAELIINHGDALIQNKYSKEKYSKVLAGFTYALIRKEFLTAAKIKKNVLKVDTVFICMGGADPYNITLKALHACMECNFLKNIFIVTGSAYANTRGLMAALYRKTDKKILHERNVTAHRMMQLINMSEIAIAPASSISMEICCVKSGLLTGTVIDNQKAIHKQLISSGCCISLGDFNKVSEQGIITHLEKINDYKKINFIMNNQSKAIDGLSGDRILNEFKKLAEC